jgi:hypothetical protein
MRKHPVGCLGSMASGVQLHQGMLHVFFLPPAALPTLSGARSAVRMAAKGSSCCPRELGLQNLAKVNSLAAPLSQRPSRPHALAASVPGIAAYGRPGWTHPYVTTIPLHSCEDSCARSRHRRDRPTGSGLAAQSRGCSAHVPRGGRCAIPLYWIAVMYPARSTGAISGTADVMTLPRA